MILVEKLVEEAIAATLRTALHPLPVDVLPEKEREPRYPNGGALVSYVSSSFGRTRSMDNAVAQEELLTFEVIVLSRTLRDRSGIYPIMRAAKIALLGFCPPHCGAMILKKSAFVDRDDNMIWSWSIEFETSTLTVSEPLDENLPLLRRLTLQDNFDNVQEIP